MPFILIRLFWKSIKSPEYRERLQERFGFFEKALPQCIWIHAVSVGETVAVTPLVKACLRLYPHLPLVLTSTTATGYVRATTIFKDTGVICGYMPYDLPGSVRRFLNKINPCVAIFMETELWPNILHACRARNIPTFLVNARLSERSAKGYRGLGSLGRQMFANLSLIGAQTEPDAKRFVQLGAAKDSVVVCGNLKFDVPFPPDIVERGEELRRTFGQNRPTWIAASTHPGEEELILKAYAKIRYQIPHILLILVPRHPERFRSVEALCKKFGFSVVSRTSGKPILETTQIYLGDTMGELMLFYAASDFAFIGGSFVEVGGHNLLEPAALGKATISGPFIFNFLMIAKELSSNRALLIAKDYNALSTYVGELFSDPARCHAMGDRGRSVVEKNRGALNNYLNLLTKFIPEMK